ncbi:MAG: hypothetical protein PV362_15460 [Providencia heimbachae]|nr:hypothetical protein [Providencia heimbachae]
MDDSYIDNIKRSQLEDKISKIAKKISKSELGGGAMVVAIENEEGEIYRVITTYGMSSYLSLVDKLADLGLTDLFADNLKPGKYDSQFTFK